MARGRLSDEEKALIRAQTAQAQAETAAQQRKLEIAAQELGVRQAAQQTEAEATQAKTAREAETLPFEKLLTLAKIGEPDVQERMNRLRAAVDILGTEERERSTQAAITAQQQERAATTKGQILDALITHYGQRADVSPSALAEILKAGGYPEAAQGLAQAGRVAEERQFETLKSQVPLLQRSRAGLEGALAGDPSISPEMRQRVLDYAKTSAPAQPQAPESQYPGYVAGGMLKYAPIDVANALSATANVTAVPFANLLNSLVGAPPMAKAPILPRDYQKAWEVLNQ